MTPSLSTRRKIFFLHPFPVREVAQGEFQQQCLEHTLVSSIFSATTALPIEKAAKSGVTETRGFWYMVKMTTSSFVGNMHCVCFQCHSANVSWSTEVGDYRLWSVIFDSFPLRNFPHYILIALPGNTKRQAAYTNRTENSGTDFFF